jgi:hypothetical protein
MSTITALTAGGVRIPIAYDPTGPVLAHAPPFEPLAFVVNEWARGGFPDLLERVERGETADWQGFGAVRVTDADLTDDMRATWSAVGGGALVDPVIVVSRLTSPVFVLPRAALVELLHALAALRADWKRAPSVPTAPAPTAAVDEREALTRTERLAVELDAAPGDGAQKRRILLGELEWYGLLDETRAAERRAQLEVWGLSTLLGYLDAAAALRAYHASAERASCDGLDPPAERLLDANVSLDWFRKRVATPPDMTPDGWLAFCEQALVSTAPDGDAGEIVARRGERACRIRYRIEARSHSVVVSGTAA